MNNFLINAKGHHVPQNMVRPEDKLEDDLVNKIIENACALNKELCDFKANVFSDVRTFQSLLLEKYGAKKGGEKGNVSLVSYNGLMKVQLSIGEFIDFGPQLQVAKVLIDECINEWAEGSRAEIRVLVNDAFQVDKKSAVNTDRVLGLRRLSIDHPKWVKAMEAITDAIRVTSSKEYVRFYERATPESEWKAITLDIARAEVSA